MEIIKQHFAEIIMMISVIMAIACALGLVWNVRTTLRESAEANSRMMEIPLFFLVCGLLAYGCMIWSKHYSVDSFNVLYDMGAFWHMQLGRYTTCGVILWAEHFGINQVISQQIFMMLWVVVLAVMMWLIYCGIMESAQRKTIHSRWIVVAILLSFLNVFAMELMLFPEMAMVLLLGNMGLGLSIRFALSDIQNTKRWALSAFFLLIALGCYQSYIGIFEAFVLTGIFLKWKTNWKKRYVESLIALGIGGAASIFNIVLVKFLIKLGFIVDVGRGASLSVTTILNNIGELVRYQIRFWTNADGLLPEVVMPVLGIATLIVLGMLLKNLANNEQRIFLVIALIGLYALGYAPHLVEAKIDLTPRSNIAVWSVIAGVWIAAGILLDQKLGKYMRAALNILFAGTVLIQIVAMQDMAANEQAMNVIDIMEAERIAEVVYQYEAETGDTISQVAVAYDEDVTKYQSISRYKNSQLGARIMATDYSSYRLIGAVLGRNLQKVDMPEDIYTTYFGGKDWDNLDVEEQMFCANQTLYIVVY